MDGCDEIVENENDEQHEGAADVEEEQKSSHELRPF